ncbi:histidine kinase [Pseudomonas capeferrum]|uniref:sensor histidine kinase n=1 Tax=Pseudomonas capeferrum TaxID=1495066 RepID=UPI0015E442F8|nr:ATP-binding protein [Pseudomonas capeferrum]MBA1203172.1 histidine kinase [Pseudomonas capeferrum]
MTESSLPASSEQATLIERLRTENGALREELEETNQGVLALYAELDNQADELRQASDLKSRFLSYMSHEFRTPLGSILSITRLLADELDGPLSPEQHKQVQFISTATRELGDMVDDLLDLAKIEAGRITISPAWFDMLDLFAALRGMFRPIVDVTAVDLIFEEPEGLPRLYTDDKKLAQILRNFISNALKFTSRGEVRVSVVLETPDRVRFAVSDTGIGIAPELHGALFEDFSQVDSPLQKRLRGTGLGLSLCKRFAVLLGGEVGFQSEPGVGSTFYVLIPLAIAQEPADES